MRSNIDEVLREAEVIIIGNKAAEFSEIEHKVGKDQKVIDLVRLFGKDNEVEGSYEGICW